MATIKIAGNVAVIESAVPLDTLKRIEKYRPKALQLFDDAKEPYFAVATSKGDGSVSRYGVSFGQASYGEGRNAVVTIDIPEGVEDVKAWVEDKVGTAILNLNKVEAQLDDACAEIDDELAAIRDHITIV